MACNDVNLELEDEIKFEDLDGEAVDAEDALEALASEQPGLLGEIINWIVATARYPNPILAIGAAVTVIGTLIGRRMRGPTKSGTHLYCIGLAPTGAGKQHVLDCARLLMKEARGGHLLGPSEFTSMSAVLHFLVRQPLSLCLQDEFGAFLKRINHSKATGWEVGVTKTFRSIWGTSFKPMETPEWANLEFKTIESPALSLLGMSVPEEFYQSLSNKDIVNGLLNRFLILANSLEVEEREPESDADVVPEPVIEKLRELYGWHRQLTAPGTFAGKPTPEDLQWADDDAKECYRQFGERVKDLGRKYSALGLGELFTRCAELAVRLAAIRAVGCRGRATTIELSDIYWGKKVAQASAMLMVAGAERHMAENKHVADRKRILDLFRKQPVMTRTTLIRKAYWLRARDLDEHMKSLVEGGVVDENREPSSNPCKPFITYQLQI
jgi:hypothetical protein